MTQTQSALVEALYRVPEHGKAEITVFLEGDVADAEPAVPGCLLAGGRVLSCFGAFRFLSRPLLRVGR